MISSPLIYVIIVTYNGRKWLKKCLGSLTTSSIPLQPIVIDNCSTDGSVEFIKQNFPATCIIQNSENEGFGKANNTGMRYALHHGAKYCLLLNQDAWIEVNTVSELLKCFKNNTEAGIVSPIQLNGKGTALDLNYEVFLQRYGNEAEIRSILSLEKKEEDIIVGFVNAAAWLLSKECIERVGAFNPLFPHYGEDNDYINRLYFHGLKLYVRGNAMVYHDRDERKKQLSLKQLKKREYVSFLKHFVNIRKSLFTSIFIVLDKLFREATFYMLKFRFNRSLAVMWSFLISLRQLPKILRNRACSRSKGAYL